MILFLIQRILYGVISVIFLVRRNKHSSSYLQHLSFTSSKLSSIKFIGFRGIQQYAYQMIFFRNDGHNMRQFMPFFGLATKGNISIATLSLRIENSNNNNNTNRTTTDKRHQKNNVN